MINREPEGYRKLLVYQKAQKLHSDLLEMLEYFPKTFYKQTHYANLQLKTIADLIDQMPRSARSTHKNIVEGWKRNTTAEYFEFLGFSIGSNSELKDDAADIITGKYKELMEIKGVMGSHFTPYTHSQLDQFRFYPLNLSLPPAVKIFLQAKEVDMLLHKLQQSLDIKMDEDRTKPVNQRVRENWEVNKQRDKEWKKYMEKEMGLVVNEDGLLVKKKGWVEKGDKETKGNKGE